MPYNILVVEDDSDINLLLCRLLEKRGYRAEPAFSGSEAKLLLSMKKYDLILLDLMLTGIPGEDLITEIRGRSAVPVIVVSAKTEIKGKIEMLRNGADDYITKPFDKDEVLARIESQLRRYKDLNNGERFEERIVYRSLAVDLPSRTARLEDNLLPLTNKELELLAILVRSPGKVFTREDLYQAVWKERYIVEDNTINVHISNLRNKLAKFDPSGIYIETVWGIGFKMV